MIRYGNSEWQLLPELNVDEATDYKIVEKRRYDAFFGTILEEVLRGMKVPPPLQSVFIDFSSYLFLAGGHRCDRRGGHKFMLRDNGPDGILPRLSRSFPGRRDGHFLTGIAQMQSPKYCLWLWQSAAMPGSERRIDGEKVKINRRKVSSHKQSPISTMINLFVNFF